jgi:octaprenyl-diphosphate synthase
VLGVVSALLIISLVNLWSTFPDTFLSTTSPTLAAALHLVESDMRQMDAVIASRLASEVPLVTQVSGYIVAAGGKRLRPALLLLTCGALGYQGSQRFNLAAVVEFIHTATLLHDDVVDESTLRRGRATANESFGNPASVLVGDFLYSRAFQMMVEAGDMRIMKTLAEATNVIAEGEVLQLMNMHDAELTQESYLRVIKSKTAKLFEASARIAALLAGSAPDVERACAAYGSSLGTAFQVVDDVLDYDGEVLEMGKNLGDDLREGKATLPIIIAMKLATEIERSTIRQAIEQGGTSDIGAIAEIVKNCGALEAARSVAAQEAQAALAALQALPGNVFTEALSALASQVLVRRY